MPRARRAAVAVAVLVAGGCGGGSAASSGDGGGPLVATVADRGSFSVPCDYSHSSTADPIVHPGHAGMGHRHDFFGATTTGPASTADTLLAGGTTCRSAFDRSAYWAPSLLAGGRPVRPTHVQAYYRAPVGADVRAVQPPPDGLQMIAGDADATAAQDPAVARWSCGLAGDAAAVPERCAATGAELRLVLVFPQCWDGENLASPDHRAHLAYLPGTDAEREVTGAACPATHPVMLPEVTVEVRYPTDLPPGPLALASGPATGGHGDLIVAWDREHLASEVDTCVRRNLRCDVTSEPERLDTAPA